MDPAKLDPKLQKDLFPDYEYTAKMDEAGRKRFARTMMKESSELYKLMVGVATAFLGGTLVFWEKIAPAPTSKTLTILGFSCALFVFSITTVVLARYFNINTARIILQGRWDEYHWAVERTRRMAFVGCTFVLLGVVGVTVIGLESIWIKSRAMEAQTQGKK